MKDGIEDVHGLGLNAMEVQMVRVNLMSRSPDEEEVGRTPRTLEGDLVVEIHRRKGKKEVRITNLDEKIKEDDTLISLSSGLAHNYEELSKLGVMGSELDVALSMHTPYYIDLAGEGDLTRKSMDSIRWAGMMTQEMGGNMVVTHMGLYGNLSKREAFENIADRLGEIVAWWESNKLAPRLGLETSGRKEVFGGLDEILELCDRFDRLVPIVNFAHLHARNNGMLREPEDFAEVFDQVRSYVGDLNYTHFSGVEHEGGNERRVTPIKKGDLRFEPLAEYLADANPNAVIISSSPLLEHDAMYMKVIYERVLTKRVSKGKKGKGIKDEDEE
ncbi:MAG TPA: TIM barrel protein [Methanomassiliicoccales archaeon]|nr:TIM barrel protein [Euryarchaeota archaeon]HOE52825.1 TIM barrel protein [Methanomassiliicoccales archaeon]HOO04431.1 TIM barrel protein [Methanomassiliicoccales archaeon]HQM67048.1 TIM barrel protein [Methanomassiliicoccales archaeon]HRU11670.1 TIM barrel protein [Methanomassiliicoccales archaeon]